MKRTAVLFLAVVAMVGLFGTARTAASKMPDEQVSSLSGQLHVIWEDRSAAGANGERETTRFILIDEAGKWIELDMDVAVSGGNVLSLNRQHVVLEGQWRQQLAPSSMDGSGATSEGVTALFRVTSVRHASAPFAPQSSTDAMSPMAATVIGTQRWVTVLCRYADATGVTPRERGWFDALMLGNDYPSMSHYWRELSFGQIDLTGSQVAGWYNLPHPVSYYVGQGNLDLGRASEDCATVADAEVYFPGFQGINFVFQDTGCCAWGGSWTLSLDGQQKTYGVTWVTAHTSVGQSVWGHEMGHGFGLPHSSGPYGSAYDSAWDIMSATWAGCAYDGPHPTFHCIGQHTIGWHKAMLGWIPTGRIYVAGPSSAQTIEIKRLEDAGDGSGYMMARIHVNGSETEFYTVETRQRVGYDNILPGDAVIIHHVDTGRWDRQAQVVDVDNNGDPNDAAAMWLPGETVVGAGGISVSVVSATANGFLVTISNGGAPPPPPLGQFTLEVGKNGNGIVTAPGIYCGSDCQEQFTDGTVVTLSASPDSGWTFVGWSGDADCLDGQVTMLHYIGCVASFRMPAPDLVGQFTSLTKKVKKGSGKVSFAVTVTNAGDQPAQTPNKKVYVAVYLSSDAVLDGSDLYLTTVSAKAKKGLVPWQSVAAKGKVTLQEPSSGKFLIAVVDPWNQVAESDESNNVAVIPIP